MTFKQLLQRKKVEVTSLKDRYTNGLEQLKFAEQQVDIMKNDIIALQPELEATSVETEQIMQKIEIDKVDVDAKKELVQADEAVANEAAMAAKAIKDECEADLAVAMPALKSAVAALDTITGSDISNIKGWYKTTHLV